MDDTCTDTQAKILNNDKIDHNEFLLILFARFYFSNYPKINIEYVEL